MNIQKAVIARAKMCETDQDRVTIIIDTHFNTYLNNPNKDKCVSQ